MIRIQNLHKFFNKGRQNEIHVINNVSLELPERGMVAVFGRSGCGKTTLLNVIGGLDSFASGSLTVENNPVDKNTDELRNRYMGYIFQNYNLNKQESCFDNVADALRLCGMEDKNEIEKRVIAALRNVDMDKYKNRTPDTLSGGQQQRIAIARAIVKNPRIILADEPTGNLDEANTVMIMDLLKAIAKDHLVLLVTHEESLVDHYCDTVIELSDGQVVNIRHNQAADGFAARDKNAIYLGELEKTTLSSDSAEIEYYGDTPDTPIKLKIVNNGGKLYVAINTPKVQVLDEFSEVKLQEGVFENKKEENTVSRGIDMTALPPVKGERFGRLFTLRSSLKSGYLANFKKGKRGKKALFAVMILFAMVIVNMTAVFGTSISQLIDAKNAYNHNVFYVYTPSGEVSQKLHQASPDESGIDYLRLEYSIPYGDQWVKFMTGFFETFSSSYYDESFTTNAVYLDTTLAEKLPLVAGKKEDLDQAEILITTAVADALLEKSSLGYIKEYRDLIGLVNDMFTVNGQNLRIAGVVRSGEPAVYLTPFAMASHVLENSDSLLRAGSQFDYPVASGETVYVQRYQYGEIESPVAGETIQLHGKDFTVKDVIPYTNNYESWLTEKGIEKMTYDAFFDKFLKEEYPDMTPEDERYEDAINRVWNKHFYEWCDYYLEELDRFIADLSYFESNDFRLWVMKEKGLEDLKYLYAPYNLFWWINESGHTAEGYYKAIQYKKEHGSYPTVSEITQSFDETPGFDDITRDAQKYTSEYNAYQETLWNEPYRDNAFLLSDEDFISLSKTVGDTHPAARPYAVIEGGKYEFVEDSVNDMASIKDVVIQDMIYIGNPCYTVIHSGDPEKTAAFLDREFSDLQTPYEYMPAMLTPDTIYDSVVSENLVTIITGFATIAVILVIMSISMYFIMRSSLMNRIKEVGIYRAIGVSKKNLIFRFFIEALVLTTLTVAIGYLLASAFVMACVSSSALVAQFFFYPAWLALVVLAVLYAICVFCGILPVLTLLAKTPSQILSKYDI